jgi:hypothetical protein
VFFGPGGPEATFSTVAEDHGHCSVCRMTHGLATLADVTDNGDVAALVGSGWVSPEAVGQIPVITEGSGAITYGPLGETPDNVDPDVVLPWINGRQLVVSDAIPGPGPGASHNATSWRWPSNSRSLRPASSAPSPGRGRAWPLTR